MPSSGVQTCALRSEEHTSELQSHDNLVCRLLLEKMKHVGQGVSGQEASEYSGAPVRGGRRRPSLTPLLPAPPLRRPTSHLPHVSFFFFYSPARPPSPPSPPHPPPP